MPRSQFSIRTLLWLTPVVAAFLGGIAFKTEMLRREQQRGVGAPEFKLGSVQVSPAPPD